MLTQWKKEEELSFLNQVSSVPLQQTLRHLTKAFENFWAKRASYPNFKKKRNGGNAEFTRAAFKWKEGKLYLAKCKEPLNIIWSRYFPIGCDPSTVTVKLEPSGKWYVSLVAGLTTTEILTRHTIFWLRDSQLQSAERGCGANRIRPTAHCERKTQ
jgi:putative transposase